MKKLLYLLVVILIFTACNRADQDKLNVARSYLDTHPDSTLICLEEIDPSGLSSKLYMEYLLTQTQARHKTSQDISNDTLLFAYKDQFRKFPDHKAAWFYFYIGAIYHLQDNIDHAITEYMEAEKLLLNDLYLQAMIDEAYADLHRRKFNLEEAIPYYQKSAESFLQIEEYVNASICYNHTANCFLYQSNVDSAFHYYDLCLQYQQYCTPIQEAMLLSNLALAYNVIGNNQTAIQYLDQALNQPLSNSEKAKIYYQLAEIVKDDHPRFLAYIQQAIDIVLEENTNKLLLSQLYRELSQYHTQNNNIELAHYYYCQYHETLVPALERQYDKTIHELRQENHIRHLQSENLHLKTTRQSVVIILLLVFVISIIGGIIIVSRYQHKQNELHDAEQRIETLQDMASQDGYEKNSLRNIVLQHFKLLKKVAQLQAISSTQNYSKTIVEKFNNIVYSQDTMNWDIFYSTINTAHNNLCDNIRNKFPTLKDSEFKVICLTIAKFSNPEIAVILNKSPHTIPGIKSLIRKKTGIIEQGNIANFFLHYWEENNNEEK